MPSANALDLPPLGHRYAPGGRPLYLHRAGTGEPAVVFLPGGGMFGLGYVNVHMRVAKFTTSVVYDRAGTGWSDAVPLPRSAEDVVRELLGVAGLLGPTSWSATRSVGFTLGDSPSSSRPTSPHYSCSILPTRSRVPCSATLFGNDDNADVAETAGYCLTGQV